MLSIQLGLVKIPCMLVNYANSRYSTSGLHQFSSCCSARVRQKKICEDCGKEVNNIEIRRGLDKDTILSEGQEERLKEVLESGIIEVVSIKEDINLTNLIPFIQKTQLILPSINKGYKKTDIKTFFSFKSALEELNKVCFVKLIQRGLEHLGILMVYNGDLTFFEIPFKHYNNLKEIIRLKEQVDNVLRLDKINNPTEFKAQAEGFINNFSTEKGLDEIEEKKLLLLKKFVSDIRDNVVTEELQETNINEEINPFL
uniref:Putative DNA repair protein n=1 Tax=viral metagenome TaxID=1070528 RepID=A0A6M3JDZ0_9ZZZZ